MQAVVEEKENRTMEVIITSVSPNQFISGKIIGDTAIGPVPNDPLVAFHCCSDSQVFRNSLTFLQEIQVRSPDFAPPGFRLVPRIHSGLRDDGCHRCHGFRSSRRSADGRDDQSLHLDSLYADHLADE